jgi:hypothetical protein
VRPLPLPGDLGEPAEGFAAREVMRFWCAPDDQQRGEQGICAGLALAMVCVSNRVTEIAHQCRWSTLRQPNGIAIPRQSSESGIILDWWEPSRL